MAHNDKKEDAGYELGDYNFVARNGSRLSHESLEDEMRLLGDGLPVKPRDHDKRRRARSFWLAAILPPTIVAVLFLLYVASRKRSSALPSRAGVRLLSNGTTSFRPTTIVVSLDGFRADYLMRGDTPTLNAFIAEGVSPAYMRPSFPSVTFPNHYTMVTGLYPESHGIVGNSFWDPRLRDEFHYTNASSSLQAKWWGGEPLWATAELQGVRTAVHMWPGSEAHIGPVEPSIVDPYNGSEVLSRKVQRILGFLDLPGPVDTAAAAIVPGVAAAAAVPEEQRPQLILAYVPDVDSAGHEYGPNSTQIHATLRRVDDMLRDLLAGLQQRNLTHVVNIVVVSDHGMATTSTGRLLQLEDLLDPALLSHTDGWPLYGLRPKRDADLQPLYEQLVARAAAQHPPAFDVYLRDGNMPARFHFARNERIAPLWIVPRTGWAIVTKKDFDVRRGRENGEIYHPRGLHGYDNEDPLMRAIFIARGPAFPHRPNSKLPVFQNIEVYNLLCDSLAITPHPNNGTLRLSELRPIGLHPDTDITSGTAAPAAAASTTANGPLTSPLFSSPPPSSLSSSASRGSTSLPTASPHATPSAGSSIGVDQPDADATRPVISHGSNNNAAGTKLEQLWKSVLDKLHRLTKWIHGGANTDTQKQTI